MKIQPIVFKDFYKSDHRKQYPNKTEFVYSNLTARGSGFRGVNKTVVFGIQYFVKEYLINQFNEGFFNKPKEEVVKKYKRRVDNALGAGAVSVDHIEALYDLGYLPLHIKALDEGSLCPLRVPMLTIVNTKSEFYWLTNFLETLLSNTLWMPMTSATTAYQYRKILDKYFDETSDAEGFVDFQGHDFSMRGMSSMESACMSGASHLTSFCGTDTIPAIDFLEEYYNADSDTELIGSSVPACYDSETEILTNRGFVKFKLLKKSDKVAQYHKNGNIDFVYPSKYYNMKYAGKMVEWYKEGYNYIDLLVTPNHKMIRFNKDKNNITTFEAGDTSYKNRAGYSHRNNLIVSGVVCKGNNMSSLDKLRIAFQADGSFPSRLKAYKSGQIRFCLKKERKIKRLEKILIESNTKFTRSVQDFKRGSYNFWINKTDGNFDKDFSWVKLTHSLEWYCDFIKELAYWDGTFSNNCIVYSNINKKAISKVQAIAVLCGYKTHLNEYVDKREDYNRKLLYNLTISKKKKVSGNGIKRKLVDYNGTVHCVSVPTKMIIVKRNGVVAVCGNTEHSVMCLGGDEDELNTYKRLINEIYPTGIVSIVSDTWDYWNVLTNILPTLKQDILKRDGKVVIRPDSGDPFKIICGDINIEDLTTNKYCNTLEECENWVAERLENDVRAYTPHGECGVDSKFSIFKFNNKYYKCTINIEWNRHDKQYYYVDGYSSSVKETVVSPENKGSIEVLYDLFGGTNNSKGYKELDSHIGLIYGECITLEVCEKICQRLKEKGYASTNVVYGIGSFTYQYVTRDTFGFAVKATHGTVAGVGIDIFKDPKTDDGLKKSAKGLLKVNEDYTLTDEVTYEEEKTGLLTTVFLNGILVKETSLQAIRDKLKENI